MKIEIQSKLLDGYKLLDSGDKQKLEEVGGLRIVRAEPKAWWGKSLPESEWSKAEKDYNKDVVLDVCGVRVKTKLSSKSKHIGIFPEQLSEWEWIEKKVSEAGKEVNILNLFGYTGVSTLVAAKAGAKVTHVDGSRTTIAWAKENQALSGLEDKSIRWILDDALAFVKREIKRGVKYDAVIMDPPTYGRGAKGEVWKVEEDLVKLLKLVSELLTDEPLFVILNMYTTELSSISLRNLLESAFKDRSGFVEVGELTLAETSSSRLLPLSIYAIWKKGE